MFTDMQKEYFREAVHRWNVKTGATRSGKTYMDYYAIPKRIRSVAGREGAVLLLGHTAHCSVTSYTPCRSCGAMNW